jgi:hypothetical protein
MSKFLVTLEENTTDIWKMLEDYGEGSSSRTQFLCGLSDLKAEQKILSGNFTIS